MKLLEFKNSVLERATLIKANIIFTFQKEFAYPGNNWANIASTVLFTTSILVFIKILFVNIKTLAGYSENDMLFFFLVSQITYYANWSVTLPNLQELVDLVNKGDLDLILIKPVPTLFFLSFRNISILSILRDGIPPTLAILLSINWNLIHISFINIFCGILTLILGLICLSVIQLIFALPVFWLGESSSILDLGSAIAANGGAYIPLEGFEKITRLFLSTLIPILIASAFTTSLLLGKSNPTNLVIWSILITIFAILVRNKIWKIALKSYTSASS